MATKLPPQRSKGEKQFLDFVESVPGKASELAGSAKDLVSEAGSGIVDFLVGRDGESDDLDAQLDDLTTDFELDAELDNLTRSSDSELDTELDKLTADRVDAIKGPGVTDKIIDRMLGNDVDDPMPFIRMGTTLTGMFGGALAGGKIGGAIGSRTPSVHPFVNPITGGAAGAVVGTAIGAIAPEATIRMGEYFGIIDPDGEFGRKQIGLSPDELQTVLEGEILLEIATAGGLTMARTLTKGATRVFVGAGGEEMAIAKRAKERGIDLIPVQVGPRLIPRGFVTVMGRFPLIAGPLRKAGERSERQIAQAVHGLSTRIAPIQRTADELGIVMFREAKGLARAITNSFNKRYTEIYARAEEAGVQVVPKRTISRGNSIVHNLKSTAPKVLDPSTAQTVPGPLSGTNKKIADFIEERIIPLSAAGTDGGRITARQSLAQMDRLVADIDEFMATLEPGQKKFAIKMMTQLRQETIRDMVTNVRGVNAGEIAQQLRNLDKEFSFTMTDIFETSLAKQITTFTKKGLRASVADPTTRTPIDTMAKLIKLDSPEAMNDLAKLVSPKTYREITAKVMDDAVNSSLTEVAQVGKQFDIMKFKRTLGLDNVLSGRYKAMRQMLNKSGGVKITELEDIAEAAKVIEGLPIPSASSFVLRRTILGGTQSFIGSILPGVTAGAVAGSTSKIAYGIRTAVSVLLFLGGGRAVAHAIANKNTVQALRMVMAEETSDVVRRNAYIQLMRLAIEGTVGDGDKVVAKIAGSETEMDKSPMRLGLEKSLNIIIKSLDSIANEE